MSTRRMLNVDNTLILCDYYFYDNVCILPPYSMCMLSLYQVTNSILFTNPQWNGYYINTAFESVKAQAVRNVSSTQQKNAWNSSNIWLNKDFCSTQRPWFRNGHISMRRSVTGPSIYWALIKKRNGVSNRPLRACFTSTTCVCRLRKNIWDRSSLTHG